MQQDGIIEIALLAHHGSTNLAESYSVSPSGANQFEALRNTVFICIIFIYHEGRAQKMRIAQGTADFQFLTDGEGLLGSDNLQFADAAARSSLHRLHVEDGTEVHLQLVGDELLQLLLGQGHFPAIEIRGLLVVIVQHLREDFLILRVAESRRIEADPLLCLILIGKIRKRGLRS